MNPFPLLWSLLLMVFSIVVSHFKTTPPPLSKADMRRRRRTIDSDRLERRALRRFHRGSHGRQRSRPNRDRGCAYRGLSAPEQMQPLPEPPSFASMMRSLRRGRRRKSGSTEATLEIQLNRFSGDWEVLRLDQEQVLSLQTSKKRAVKAAEKHLREEGGGKILVLDDTGKVLKEKSVAARKAKQLALQPLEIPDGLLEDLALLFT